MAETRPSFPVYPGRGLGWITLGASLHGVLARFKAQSHQYGQLDLAYSVSEPVLDPIVLNLPDNGIRLRFDGPDQRLRLIEILDFSKSTFTYKSSELVRKPSTANDDFHEQVAGPSFKHLYNRLFGPSYPGEYIVPNSGEDHGTYVLSWPGIAAKFSLRSKTWSEKTNFVSLLSSSAASPASSLAIFSGASWPEVRPTLYSKRPNLPRSISLANKTTESIPDEVEEIVVHAGGKLELFRRTSVPLMVVLNETTPQDLVVELGPPDAIFRKSAGRISVQAGGATSKDRLPSISPTLDPHLVDHEQSSNKNYTDDSENEVAIYDEAQDEETRSEAFYNYFHHGFDVLISTPHPCTTHDPDRSHTPADLVATKIFLHGNVPGSFAFNRHRRSRWRIAFESNSRPVSVTSEMRFQEVSGILKQVYRGSYRDAEEEKRMQRGMVLNRGWGECESPESSIELLGGFEEGTSTRLQGSARGGVDASVSNFNNTELFGFPGLLFEVLKNDTISCLTVYQTDP